METLTQFSEANEKAASAITRGSARCTYWVGTDGEAKWEVTDWRPTVEARIREPNMHILGDNRLGGKM